jgi:hypothetical protein
VEGEFKFVGSNDVCDLVGFLELKVYVASGSANMTPIGMLKGSNKTCHKSAHKQRSCWLIIAKNSPFVNHWFIQNFHRIVSSLYDLGYTSNGN